MQRLLGHNHGSSPTFRWVLGVHVTALAALVLSGWFREWLKPDLEVIPVSMIEIPADTPVTETVQKDERRSRFDAPLRSMPSPSHNACASPWRM